MAVLLAACDKANRIVGQRAYSSSLKQPICSSSTRCSHFLFLLGEFSAPSIKEEQGLTGYALLPCRYSFASEETRA